MIKFVLALLVLSTFSLSAAEVNPATSLMRAVKLLAKADLSCNSTNDCELVSVGHRACGGPAGHEVVSQLNANYEEILFLAQSSEQKGKIYNQDNGIISICIVTLPPQVTCKKKLCVTK
jgi:hypothetical protein